METVADALARYHRENGFREDAMVAETVQVRLFGLPPVELPSPRFQRHLLAKHDLHHVLTGYGTDLRGEAEMGAYELGAGSLHWFVWLNNLGALWLGLLCPWRTLRAFVRGSRARSLYLDEAPYEELLATPLDELRRRLRVAPS